MSKKIGMNVSLGLDTGRWQAGLNRAKRDMKDFTETAKKLGPKVGLGGLGKVGGLLGDAGSVFGGGVTMAGIGGLLVGFAGISKTVRTTVSAINSMNAAVMDARKSLASFAKDGQWDVTQMNAFTKRAATLPINMSKPNQFGDVLASNFATKSVEDAMVNYAISSIPAALSAMAGEASAIAADSILGRSRGNWFGRVQAAGAATVAGGLGETGADVGARMLEEQRQMVRYQKMLADEVRGN